MCGIFVSMSENETAISVIQLRIYSGAIQRPVCEPPLKQEDELLAHDRDIRNLWALAIHIAEAYDLACWGRRRGESLVPLLFAGGSGSPAPPLAR
jgi:hypothetical protein